jgi:hypothetical protein
LSREDKLCHYPWCLAAQHRHVQPCPADRTSAGQPPYTV